MIAIKHSFISFEYLKHFILLIYSRISKVQRGHLRSL